MPTLAQSVLAEVCALLDSRGIAYETSDETRSRRSIRLAGRDDADGGPIGEPTIDREAIITVRFADPAADRA